MGKNEKKKHFISFLLGFDPLDINAQGVSSARLLGIQDYFTNIEIRLPLLPKEKISIEVFPLYMVARMSAECRLGRMSANLRYILTALDSGRILRDFHWGGNWHQGRHDTFGGGIQSSDFRISKNVTVCSETNYVRQASTTKT